MTAQLTTQHLDDEDVITSVDRTRSRVGESIVKFAERLRMLGERIIGVLPATDGDVLRETYDWGYRMGRDHALRTLVGDEAAKDIVRATWKQEEAR